MRKIDKNKIKKIINCLRKHPEGTYVSEIARESGLSKSTVSFILSRFISEYIEIVKIGKKNLFKIIRVASSFHCFSGHVRIFK
jgi:uncharacterized membrane protein